MKTKRRIRLPREKGNNRGQLRAVEYRGSVRLNQANKITLERLGNSDEMLLLTQKRPREGNRYTYKNREEKK